jgi:hypothetical protein
LSAAMMIRRQCGIEDRITSSVPNAVSAEKDLPQIFADERRLENLAANQRENVLIDLRIANAFCWLVAKY